VVGLDKSHAAHVGREVENPIASFGCFLARVKRAQVDQLELGAVLLFFEILAFDPIADNDFVSFFLQALGQVRSNEACTPSDADGELFFCISYSWVLRWLPLKARKIEAK
jgi:hypothetical protein